MGSGPKCTTFRHRLLTGGIHLLHSEPLLGCLPEVAILKEPGGTRGELWKGRALLMQVNMKNDCGTSSLSAKSGFQSSHLTREEKGWVFLWFG